MTINRVAGMILACLLCLPAIALAQVAGSVVGTVQDTSGAVIPGATVTVKNLDTGAARTIPADERGYYRALSLSVGRYEVTAEKTGFKSQVRTGINLVVGQEAVVNLNLEVGEVQQSVTVTAEAPIVNTTTAATSGLVGEREVKDLPLNGRSFDNLITLNPGTGNLTALKTSGSTSISPGAMFTVSGMRGTDNLFLLNGVEFAGGASTGTTPGGASGELLGIDAVREFNVQSNTYGAEYGKRAGGQVGIVTMSGGNLFHGSMFEFLRNSFFDARNFFDVTKPAFRRNDFGASAGGPIRKDKTFIFGNYEGYRQSLTSTIVSFVPDNNARQGILPVGPGNSLVNVGLAPGMAPYFAVWPAQNGPELGGGIAYSYNTALNPVREDFGTLRLDQVFSEKDALSGVYTIDDGSNLTPSSDPYSAHTLTERMQVLSLEETHTFSPTVLNTARVGFTRGGFYSDTLPMVSLPPTLSIIAGRPMGEISIGGSSGGVSGGAISTFGSTASAEPRKRNIFTYSDSVQIVKGKQLITLGAWFERVQFNMLNSTTAYGAATFSDLQTFIQGQASTVIGGGYTTWLYWRQWEGAWYATDTIKVSPNLTLTLGIRHEFTNGWNASPAGSQTNYLFGPGGVMQTQTLTGGSMFTQNNAKWLFGPRAGLAWDPFGTGKTSIHAGFGTYYNLMDDLGYITPQPSYFQTAAVQFPFQVNPSSGLLPPGGQAKPRSVQPNADTPTLEEWSFRIEQQITPSTGLSVGYVGSHGFHLLGFSDLNLAFPVICSAAAHNCPSNLPDGTTYYAPKSPRANPVLSSSTTWMSFVDTSYNSLQVDLKQRLTQGLTFRANYAYSKSLDDSSQLQSSFMTNCTSAIMDSRNPIRDYGPSCYDVTNRFSFSGGYELPIGKGKAFLNGLSEVPEKLVGGWRLNAIVTVQSGLPFNTLVGSSISGDGYSGAKDRVSANPNFTGPVILGTPNEWYNPNAFMLPPAGTYGNVGRNTLRGPGLTNLDLSLFKDTRIGEKAKLEFRAEVFNALNHPNFGSPVMSMFTSSGAVSGSAGVISTTTTMSRQIQLGLKVVW